MKPGLLCICTNIRDLPSILNKYQGLLALGAMLRPLNLNILIQLVSANMVDAGCVV